MSNDNLDNIQFLTHSDFRAMQNQPIDNPEDEPTYGMLLICTTVDEENNEHHHNILLSLEMCMKLQPVLKQFIRQLSFFDEYGVPGDN